MKELSATEREIALMVVVDLWNPGRRVAKIASHFNLKPIAVECLLNRPEFKEEVARQEAISEGRCADLTMEDRRRRVADISDLVQKIPAKRVRLRMKLLDAIRREVRVSL